jgi:hypothetical protein
VITTAFQLHLVTQPVPDCAVRSARTAGDHRPSRTIRRHLLHTKKIKVDTSQSLHQLE